MVVGLAIVVSPAGAVGAFGAFPLVMVGPGDGVVEPCGVADKAIGLHVGGMVGGIVPEGICLGGMVFLPFVVDVGDDFARLGGLGGH